MGLANLGLGLKGTLSLATRSTLSLAAVLGLDG